MLSVISSNGRSSLRQWRLYRRCYTIASTNSLHIGENGSFTDRTIKNACQHITSKVDSIPKRYFTQLQKCQYNDTNSSLITSSSNTHRLYSTSTIQLSSSSNNNNNDQNPANNETNITNPPFSKVLIANRGEIALRILRSCRSLSIPSVVAVHSTIDARSPHVLAADEAVCLGPAPSSESYLNIDAVCDAILATGADAVHPGYGFLSENSEFAKRVSDLCHADTGQRVRFIGPSSDAMVAMGDKITSKQIARDANVNVIPGYDGIVTSPDEAVQIAVGIGYPVMIKASAGGGGKGMRICRTDEEVREGYALSSAEAKSFFNDERLFIEKFIERPHHIEIQVLAGRSEGGDLEILCFPERECSIQRRNQKIIEESPSVLLTPETRAEMVRQVKRLVRKVDYESAGTVEFLVDEEQNFYFLEMNTRLQVEHPITEMVSGGVDLVRGMLEVAAGRGIPKDYLALMQDYEDDFKAGRITEEEKEGMCVPYKGHAIEARIYAEDPLRGFLPSIGSLVQYIEPPTFSQMSTDDEDDYDDVDDDEYDDIDDDDDEYDDIDDDDDNEYDDIDDDDDEYDDIDGSTSHGCDIRVDSGVVEGSKISQYYDPMISKLIAYSPNSREDAIAGLGDALDRYVIRGVGHNASFASDVLRHAEFKAGRTPTSFIEAQYPDGFTGVKLDEKEQAELVAVAATVSAWKREMLEQPPLALSGQDFEDGGNEVIVCLGGMFGDAFSVKVADDETGRIEVRPLIPRDNEETGDDDDDDDENDESCHQDVFIQTIDYDPCNPVVVVQINGSQKAVQVQGEDKSGLFSMKLYGADVDVLVMSPKEYELSLHMNEPKPVDTSNFVLSPMPGTLMSYAVEEGDHVQIGQEICIVEAMKMQNILRSARAGVIGKCRASVGSSLKADEVIVEFIADEINDDGIAS